MFRLILCLMLLTLFIICIVLRSVYQKDALPNTVVLNEINALKRELPWFFKNNSEKAVNRNSREVWLSNTDGDEIVGQLMNILSVEKSKNKTIFFSGKFKNEVVNSNLSCPVNNYCQITYDKSKADAVVYKDFVTDERDSKVSPNQIWVLHKTGNPLSSLDNYEVNMTATYRSISDIVVPHGKWLYYDKALKIQNLDINYSGYKLQKAAMITHCQLGSSAMDYVKQLRNYIEVDLYGDCGDYACPKNEDCMNVIAKKYKFYLSFEEVKCREYITENFFDALRANILPVVMGAHKSDYSKVAPLNSYIHVDDFQSPKELADYLNLLHKNHNLYNKYFYWKGTGEFIDNHFFCRLCAMLHSKPPRKIYENIGKWWNDTANCTLNI